ncbi:MAG: division/cell wall cluster transcriptional repressor MraZ [Bacteroidota bacterium]|nr:division/cell wall cluster transcriptional repressor MraZ [Bacteroidota bacterium]
MYSFAGDFPGKVDNKERIVLPAAFKNEMTKAGEKIFVVRKDFHEPCLFLYPESEWDSLIKKIAEASSITNKKDRSLLRRMGKNVLKIGFSLENGRMLIPKRFLEMANIEKNVVLEGLGNYIEIWDKSAYELIDYSSEDFSNDMDEKLK